MPPQRSFQVSAINMGILNTQRNEVPNAYYDHIWNAEMAQEKRNAYNVGTKLG